MRIGVGVPESPFLVADGLFEFLGMLYISARLRQIGHETVGFRFGDGMAEAERMAAECDLLAVTGVSAHRETLEKLGRIDGVRKIVGGVHASLYPQKMLDAGFDAVVVGEADCITTIHLGADGVVTCPVGPIDDIVLPDRGLFSRQMPTIYGRQAESMTIRRGCPYCCCFCAKMAVPCRKMSRKRIEAEIIDIVDRGAGTVIFYDDCFTFGRQWVLDDVCPVMREYGLLWRAMTRADQVDGELLERMKDSGLMEITVGVESGNQRVLDILGKRTSVATNTAARALCRKVGVLFKAYMMVGVPGDSEESVEDSIRWVETNRPDSLGLYIFHPLPGSAVYADPGKFGITIEDRDAYLYAGRAGVVRASIRTEGLSSTRIGELHTQFAERARVVGVQI